ncbi:Undecaprenyl-phosphate 4-deoxy-4-formamido-L-arabinose transferase [Lacunisphaera limnophila]|uniref:Undecaprenyl-phosphate 4-deoxy-4-formamido-L-arabinose transferase n=1 Tax=Lacunisphaera limnophila TaxID=1838286 RepID=A0A1D8AZ72_9BACT|nr:glycosyltransferase [Lacunisphaera limnophila]AOS46196.1 Undecaprenyl-phosphate 4-deoxy-4-formamido-L-arabinose transferase [Lacunisphaera limnophila]
MSAHTSLVIPLYNEAGNILPLVGACVDVLNARGRDYEIILVDDGSTDGTAAEIKEACARWPRCVVLTRPHAGQAAALLAGLQAARGDLLLTLDGDGQNDPRDFPALLDLVESDQVDLACGWRVDRHDSTLRRVMSRLANLVRRRVLADGVHDAGCQLRVMRRTVRDALFPFELMQSFIPAIAVAAGFRVGELPVRHHPRRHGDSKYGFLRLWLSPALAMLRLRRELRQKFPR